MTKIVFYRSGGVFYGFEEQGHTGYGEAGDDILCAAVSSMTMFLINTVEVAYDSHVDYDISEDDTRVRVRVKAAQRMSLPDSPKPVCPCSSKP